MSESKRKRHAGAEHASTVFKGFSPRALQFFHELAAHQDRQWFQEHQSVHESEVQQPMAALIMALAAELAKRQIPLTGDPKRSTFRIHRDVRFSRDKSPYKTHAGAVLTPDGNKKTQGLLYVHISPEGSFTAAGFYQPEPSQLAQLRKAIVESPDQLQQMERTLQKAKLSLNRSEALKRVPRGFEDVPAGPAAEALKLKSFVVHRDLTEDLIGRPRLVKLIADFAESALPLLQFGWHALGQEDKPE